MKKLKYLKTLNEWRQQLEIPFDKNGKPAHINVLDGLLDIKTKTKVSSYTSSEEIDSLIEYAKKGALEDFINEYNDEYMLDTFRYDFLEMNDVTLVLYTQDFIDTMSTTEIDNNGKEFARLMSISDIDDEMLKNQDDIRDCLNVKGIKKYDKYERDRLLDIFEDYFWEFNSEVNDNNSTDGLIDIWRVITYNKAEPNLDDMTNGDKENFNKDDEYHDIIARGCVGEYWSWAEDAAAPHCGGGGGIDLLLHGRVKPEYVNWASTLYKNVYALKDEAEIEILQGKEILLYDVTTYVASYSHRKNGTKSVSLDIEPMIVIA
jgi:hypothetical protein